MGVSEHDASAQTEETVNRFSEAFNRQDVGAIMGTMTEDCVFDSPAPFPNGTRFQGAEAVQRVWEEFFASSPNAVFETEEMFACGDRCVVRWLYRWVDNAGAPGHVRGVDIFRVRDTRVCEKLTYVKG